MKSPLPALLTAGCLTLSVALTACGSPEPEPASGTETADTVEGPAPTDVPELLEGLAEAFGSVSSYTSTTDISAHGLEEGDLTRTATCTVMTEPEAHHCVSEMPYAGQVAMGVFEEAGYIPEGATVETLAHNEFVKHDGMTIIGDPHGIYGVDTPWVRSGNPDNTVSVSMPLAFDLEELPDLIAVLGSLEAAEHTGTEEVDGAEVTVVEGSLDTDGLDTLEEAQREALVALLGRTPEELDATLWVDGDGFPLRVALSADGSEGVLEFSELGTASFEIPAEDEITVL